MSVTRCLSRSAEVGAFAGVAFGAAFCCMVGGVLKVLAMLDSFHCVCAGLMCGVESRCLDCVAGSLAPQVRIDCEA